MGTERSSCRQCAKPLPAGANYCPSCGLAIDSFLVDPLGVTDATPIPAEPTTSGPGQRLGLLAGLVVAGLCAVGIWTLASRSSEPGPDSDNAAGDSIDEASDETATEDASSPSTTTEATSTITPTTTTATVPVIEITTVAMPEPIADVATGSELVLIRGRWLDRLDLGTGTVTSIELEHGVGYQSPSNRTAVGGAFVSVSSIGAITGTDLTTGEQTRLYGSDAGFNGGDVLGVAGPSSVWAFTWPMGPDPDGATVTEVALDGEVVRQVLVPTGFWPRAADGSFIYLDGPGGSWRYDTSTFEAVDLDGQFVAAAPLAVLRCTSIDDCHLEVDADDGRLVVAGGSEFGFGGGTTHLSPDGSWALSHHYTRDGRTEFSGIDVRAGTRVELGDLPIEPYGGGGWLLDSSWFVGAAGAEGTVLAIDVATGDSHEIDLPIRRVVTQTAPVVLVVDPATS